MLTWNGRLDNREELIRQLRDDLQHGPMTITDLEIVMAAYLKWGKACFAYFIGDFCLTLWDARLKVLYLVRDVVGTRTLYFHIDKERVCWSTQLSPLLDLFGINPEVEEEYIAGQLTRVPEPGLTPYKDVHAVKPAHIVTISQVGNLNEQRFWGLDPTKEIRYQNEEQYVEHFLQEFGDAVRCRLRSDRPVFAELSGGLDSSSIVCMADQILERGQAQTACLETVSQVFDESPSADERKFIVYVEKQRGVTGHHIREDDYRMLTPLPGEVVIVTPNPVLLSFSHLMGLREAMSASGARVLLSGQGGDELLGSNYSAYPEVADHLLSFKPLLLHRQLQRWSQALNKPYLQVLWESAVIPILPRRMQTVLKRGPANTLPPWFSPEFIKRRNLRERSLGTKDIYGFRLPSGRDQSAGFISMVRSVSLGCRSEQSNIDIAYPYLHRPLVEFLQAIPFEQLLRPGENRSLMRRAMQGVLPEKIARRKTKGNPQEVIARALAREWSRLRPMFTDARVCARGYMEPGPLLAALDRAKHGCEPLSSPLLSTICLELWLRAFEQRCAARSPGIETAETLPRMISGREIAVSVEPASQQPTGVNHKRPRSRYVVGA
jgi:asparagine synthase (glutamine-hydrolysing)